MCIRDRGKDAQGCRAPPRLTILDLSGNNRSIDKAVPEAADHSMRTRWHKTAYFYENLSTPAGFGAGLQILNVSDTRMRAGPADTPPWDAVPPWMGRAATAATDSGRCDALHWRGKNYGALPAYDIRQGQFAYAFAPLVDDVLPEVEELLEADHEYTRFWTCLLYTSPSPRD